MIVIFLILGIKRYFDGQVNKIQCYTRTRAYDEVEKIKKHCYEIHSILLKKEKVGQRRCIFVGKTMLKTHQFSSS